MPFKVVVTGFGPFDNHPVNASWETAKSLILLDFQEHGIDLNIEEIPVAYETVVSVVPALWEKHKPELMVHIGVSGMASEVTLEALAHKAGYQRKDVRGLLPLSGECCVGQDESLTPQLDLDQVCLQVNSTKTLPISTCISHNAGRYVCEFTFYASLSIDKSRTVFIHVPDIDKPYSVSEMAQGVREIIILLVQQIQSKQTAKN